MSEVTQSINYEFTQDELREAIKASLNSHKAKYTVLVTVDEAMEVFPEDGTCRYCGHKMGLGSGCRHSDSVSVDRVYNESIMTRDNIQYICAACNTRKGNFSHNEYIHYMRVALMRNDTAVAPKPYVAKPAPVKEEPVDDDDDDGYTTQAQRDMFNKFVADKCQVHPKLTVSVTTFAKYYNYYLIEQGQDTMEVYTVRRLLKGMSGCKATGNLAKGLKVKRDVRLAYRNV